MDTTLGRFINEDPIFDGTNWYIYAGGNPIMFHDPSGLAIQFAPFIPKIAPIAVEVLKWAWGTTFVVGGLIAVSNIDTQTSSRTRSAPYTGAVSTVGLPPSTLAPPATAIPPTTVIPASTVVPIPIATAVAIPRDITRDITEPPILQGVVLYHGSYNNYSNIRRNGFDVNRTPIYMTQNYLVAENAIYGRYDIPTDAGVITAVLPKEIYDGLVNTGAITIRSGYTGFGDTMTPTHELQVHSEAIAVINMHILR